jgi:hypothetical protein
VIVGVCLTEGGGRAWRWGMGGRVTLVLGALCLLAVSVRAETCTYHASCPTNNYCDSTGHCYSCTWITSGQHGCDAIDDECGVCGPVGGGGAASYTVSGADDNVGFNGLYTRTEDTCHGSPGANTRAEPFPNATQGMQ